MKLDERGRRLFAASEANAIGRGGQTLVSKITGLAPSTLVQGKKDLAEPWLPNGQIRRKGGGRCLLSKKDPGLIPALKNLVDPATLGDPMRDLRWRSKSLAKLSAALTEMGHPIGVDTVGAELAKLGISRMHNRIASGCQKWRMK